MPKKTFKRKARRRTRKGKKRSRSNRHSGMSLIYNHPRWPLPPTLFTTFVSCIQGVIAGSSAATNRYTVNINSLYLPYSVSVGSALPAPIVYTTATLMPQGVSNICNTTNSNSLGLYNFYKVIAVDIIFKCKPSQIGDNVNIAITPFIDSNQPGSHQASLADPESVNRDIGSTFGQSLRKKLYMHRLFGLTKRQYMDDVSGQYSSSFSSAPSRLAYAQFSYNTNDNNTTGTAMGYQVEIRFISQLWFPIGKLLAAN